MLCSSLKLHIKPSMQNLCKEFPLTSLNLLSKDGLEPIKPVEALLLQGKIGIDIALLLDTVCLQRDAQYQGS